MSPGKAEEKAQNAPAGAAPRSYPGSLTKVPFVRDVDIKAAPFSELKDQSGVDDPTKMLEGWTGITARRELGINPPTRGPLRLEARVGRYQASPSGLLQLLADRRRAVAIIAADGVDYHGDVGEWSGTGFIVGRNLLLTNHHVLHSPEIAAKARIDFNYEIPPDSLLAGDGRRPQGVQSFALDPARLFLTSPTDGGLDFTFVWIDEAASATRGMIPMQRDCFTVSQRELAFVIHHPDGEPKQVSLDDTDVLAIEANVIHYSSDTMAGSSGAPVFDRRGRLIALHHASMKMDLDLPDGGKTDTVNEGIKIAAIAMDLDMRVQAGKADASFAEAILREIKGSDTMSGFFGGAGRRIDSNQPAPEAVVAAYRGTDQDVDVGFWNIEWLANRYDRAEKLDGAAKVIADLNLDLWGLSEISPPAVKALVERIERIYGQQFAFGLSEPKAAENKQSTAMIWRTNVLKGERVDWPAEIEPLFRQRSDDPDMKVEAVHGRIFDRYPGLFRFETIDPLPRYRFYAVPLHLKAMEEGSLRRKLAARILARAVEALTAIEPLDVILGGDMNAPLASGDFKAIEDGGFAILGALDEKEGAFSYVKSPKSAIDNIFLSPSMRRAAGSTDFFIVARDRVMPNYLDISDHRPIAVRLSLSKAGMDENPVDLAALDSMIDKMLKGSQTASRSKRKTKTAQKAVKKGKTTTKGVA